MRGGTGDERVRKSMVQDQDAAYQPGLFQGACSSMRINGHLPNVGLQHAHVLLVDAIRSGRFLEPSCRGSGRGWHKLRHDLGQHDVRRSNRAPQSSYYDRMGHGSWPIGCCCCFQLHSNQYRNSGARSGLRFNACYRGSRLHHLVRFLLWRIRWKYRLDEHRFLPNGKSAP